MRGKHTGLKHSNTGLKHSNKSTSKVKIGCTWLYCESMNSGVMLGIPAIAPRLSDATAPAMPESSWAYVMVSNMFRDIQRVPLLFTWSLTVKVVCKRRAVSCHVVVAMEGRRGTLGPFSCQIECPGKATRFSVCRTQRHSWTSAFSSISLMTCQQKSNKSYTDNFPHHLTP